MATSVALLRGINVGGKNALPMRELTALFEAAGASDVQTYIQSGNVVFKAAGPDKVAAAVEKRIADTFKLRVPIVLRTSAELAKILRANPFLAHADNPKALHVMFLAGKPAARAVAALDAKRSPPDAFRVIGREIYLCCPNGMARTRLTNDYFDRALATTSTVRNWRTVLTLAELSAA
jgi:uncharacterized protein (DUF1697 family)